ncbi:MAG: phenylacetate--CoA ligase family protein [Gemmataceae bacterium]
MTAKILGGRFPERSVLEKEQIQGLRRLLTLCEEHHLFYREKFAQSGIDPSRLELPRDWSVLPFTTKEELLRAQQSVPPHGNLISQPFSSFTRLHQTSGTLGRPLRWFDTRESWQALLEIWKDFFSMAGVDSADVIFFPFSFGPFLGFWSAFEAACQIGCLCLPGGGMSTLARLRFLLDCRATVVLCTPTYALRMLEVAKAECMDLTQSSVRAIIVAGEPGGSIASTRERIEKGWNARVFDHNGMTETGPLGMECRAQPGGIHLHEEHLWVEVLDPASNQPVPPGKVGELIITTIHRQASPLIRYRTGDLVQVDKEACPCGSSFIRLQDGIRGRVDDMVFLRGNNLHPDTLQLILHRIQAVEEYQIEIDESNPLADLVVRIEIAGEASPEETASVVEKEIRGELLFRPRVEVVPVGTLPRPEMKSRRIVKKMATKRC